jgi:hypothetical protein
MAFKYKQVVPESIWMALLDANVVMAQSKI